MTWHFSYFARCSQSSVWFAHNVINSFVLYLCRVHVMLLSLFDLLYLLTPINLPKKNNMTRIIVLVKLIRCYFLTFRGNNSIEIMTLKITMRLT